MNRLYRAWFQADDWYGRDGVYVHLFGDRPFAQRNLVPGHQPFCGGEIPLYEDLIVGYRRDHPDRSTLESAVHQLFTRAEIQVIYELTKRDGYDLQVVPYAVPVPVTELQPLYTGARPTSDHLKDGEYVAGYPTRDVNIDVATYFCLAGNPVSPALQPLDEERLASGRSLVETVLRELGLPVPGPDRTWEALEIAYAQHGTYGVTGLSETQRRDLQWELDVQARRRFPAQRSTPARELLKLH